jgi:tetratricopeptide (TPR) repeat protein
MNLMKRGRRRWSTVVAPLLALAFISSSVSIAAGNVGIGEPGASPDLRRTVLELLHDGRFDKADRLLSRAARRDGEQAEEAFFRAFVTYWRLLYDPDNETLRDRFARRLDRTIELAKAESKRQESWEGALWSGSAHLLRAQLRAMRKKVFKAGFDAKKAHRDLKRAAELGREHAESDFGLGTYQYYASRVPGIVKFLRGLLTIPGGNREEGLQRLRRAARESLIFSLEARIVLANIYARDDERLYDLALAETEAAGRQFPETLAVLDGSGRIFLSLYRAEQALDRLERALARGETQAGTSPSVLANLRFYTAAAESARFRPDRALEVLRPLLESPDAVPRDMRSPAHELAAGAISLQTEPPSWVTGLEEPVTAPGINARERQRLRDAAAALELARPALELARRSLHDEAARTLAGLAATHPDSAALQLVAARSLILAGHADDALPLAVRAVDSDDLPRRWAGTASLLAGIASDLSGRREPAVRWYTRAAGAGSFDGRDAARLYQIRPCTSEDLAPAREIEAATAMPGP